MPPEEDEYNPLAQPFQSRHIIASPLPISGAVWGFSLLDWRLCGLLFHRRAPFSLWRLRNPPIHWHHQKPHRDCMMLKAGSYQSAQRGG